MKPSNQSFIDELLNKIELSQKLINDEKKQMKLYQDTLISQLTSLYPLSSLVGNLAFYQHLYSGSLNSSDFFSLTESFITEHFYLVLVGTQKGSDINTQQNVDYYKESSRYIIYAAYEQEYLSDPIEVDLLETDFLAIELYDYQ